MNDVARRIATLTKEIDLHSYLYYSLGTPVITDHEWDELFRELRELETAYPEFAHKNSPTQRVGWHAPKGSTTFKHGAHMYSLDNAFTYDEVVAWMQNIIRQFKDVSFVCELKYDGLSINLHYYRGKLTVAAVRGDGVEGEIVTDNALAVAGIPSVLHTGLVKQPDIVEVRGEVLLPYARMSVLNATLTKPYSNTRNAAAGILRGKDPLVVLQRGLIFQPYQLETFGAEDAMLSNQVLQLIAMEGWGLGENRSGFHQTKSPESVVKHLELMTQARENLPFEIDGVVIKVLDIGVQQQLGYTARHPNWAIAYKFPAKEAMTTLTDVFLQVGRSGVITPVGHFKPVKLGGVVVSKATLHNFDEIRRLDLKVGDRINVKRAGDVIPKITHVDLAARKGTERDIREPTHCPICSGQLVRHEGEVDLYCVGGFKCTPQLINNLINFASRGGMNIHGLGEAVITDLVNRGTLISPMSIYQLEPISFAGLRGYGETKVNNLLTNIRKSRDVKLNKFITALGIPGVGEVVATKLADEFGTVESFLGSTKEQLVAMDGIEDITATSIRNYLDDPVQWSVIMGMLSLGVTPSVVRKVPKKPVTDDMVLSGQTWVVTGEVPFFGSREKAKERLQALGATVADDVSKKTNYLLVGGAAGKRKVNKAKELGIPVVNAFDFVEIYLKGEKNGKR